jgi:general transcription factor 3C polypeptide 4
MQVQSGQVAQGLLAAISHCVLRILVRHLKAIVPVMTGVLQANSVPYLLSTKIDHRTRYSIRPP